MFMEFVGQAADSHAVDIASLEVELMAKLEAAAQAAAVQQNTSTPPCPITIAEVGELTRGVEPRHVSIGPYSRRKNLKLAKDDEKAAILGSVLSAASAGTTLRMCLDEMAGLENRARDCYADRFEDNTMPRKDFVSMLLLDGAYVLFRFVRVPSGSGLNARTANGHVLRGGSAPSASAAASGDQRQDVAVVHDVFYLAENQIPFFVVDKIHRLVVDDNGITAAAKIADYVRELLQTHYSVVTPDVAEPPGPGNLLHLVHMHFKPAAVGPPSTGEPVRRWRRATEYHFAGVKFKGRPLGTNGAQCILDVKLGRSGGTLEVPHLNIDGETWPLLRNLMALEQRNPDVTGTHVTAYCVFMSQVACMAEDVALLSRRGIIAHGLGNDGEVADFFADLCKDVVFTVDDAASNYLRATCQELEKKFQSKWGRWAAWLLQKYFSNPWLAVGLAAAAVGVACAVVQAVYSVLGYRQGAH
ncbi:unnamed protein product [Urochloa decumbens]|uniref:Uncharacterized protein n=1 Tax=Urochloa decumbens TaxID=240449 RepID=A0ABC9BV78_9POAL